MSVKIKYCIIAFSALFVVACSNYEGDEMPLYVESEIFGVWVDTVAAQPRGYYVNELAFSANGAFVSGTNFYGLYDGQAANELSGYFEYYGNYVLSAKNIYFVSKQTVSWDNFTGGNPVTTVKDEVIFESCTYKIDKNTLELSYITYPADAPVVTTRRYIRSE